MRIGTRTVAGGQIAVNKSKRRLEDIMSRVYNSLKLKMQDTLQWGKTISLPLARVNSSNALSLNHKMERLEGLVADRIGELKAAVKAGEAMVEEAQRAEQLAGNLKADIAAMEAKLKEMEETIRRKDFSDQKMEAEIKNLQNDLKKKEETLATRGDEINDYKSKIDDNVKQIAELELANRKTKEEAASHAKRAEDLAENSKAKITALESEVKETKELTRHKDSTIKELEQKLAAMVQQFESMVKEKQELLTRRDSEMNDLKSQLKRLTKAFGEMSSLFMQAEALAGIETQDVSTAAQNGPVDDVEEKAAAVQSNIARVTPIVPDAPGEMVSPEIFQRIINELAEVTNVMAPLASLLVHQQAKALGESVEKFPRTRLPELLEALAKEISDENRQIDFRQRLAQSAQITLN
jgi:DNA repair exonuclease SbcCD ATPase subunit